MTSHLITPKPGDPDKGNTKPRQRQLLSRPALIALSCGIVIGGLALTAYSASGAMSGGAGDMAGGAHATEVNYWPMAFVFLLSSFIGLGVIRRVSRLLHTPLMSLTNAISAIAVVGAILVAGPDHPPIIQLLGGIALFASVTNIVSGFLITDRMLKMFKQER